MSSIKELFSLGKELGYEGDQLLDFIKEEQDSERKVRLEQREAREAEERNLKLQLALQEAKRQNESVESNSEPAVRAKGPSLPPFDETKDDCDSYIRRFELFARSVQWPKENWGVILSSYLKGAALETYARLTEDEAVDYDKVRLVLMERFNCTSEGFRKRFRSCKPQRGERVEQFVNRMKNLLQRWVELSNHEETYQSLVDLLLIEQLMESCSKPLQVFLRERFPLTLKEIVEISEGYVLAHGGLINNCNKGHSQSEAQGEPKAQSSSDTDTQFQKKQGELKCFNCGKLGHKAYRCRETRKTYKQGNACQELTTKSKDSTTQPANPSASKPTSTCAQAEILECGHSVEVVSAMASMPVAQGTMCGKKVDVLRDTGCSTVVVKRDLVPENCFTGETCLVRVINGQVDRYPLAQVEIQSPYYSGCVTAVCMENPVYDVIVGNIKGATRLEDPERMCKQEVNAVVTRAAAKRGKRVVRKLSVPDLERLEMDVQKMLQAQQQDGSLLKWRELARDENQQSTGKSKLVYNKGLLYRENVETGHRQLVLPSQLRSIVMTIGHESTFGGHLGFGKTLGKVQADFAWPGMVSDVKRHCQSCDVCQKTVPRGKIGKVPLGEMPLIDTPFMRVAVDLVGPIEPRSETGNRYILTLVDYATRYPEAIALPSVDTDRVAEALLEMFSRVGVPTEIVTDRGSQFTSQMMTEVRRLLSIKHLPTTPYHAMGNGLVERFNGTLKQMLKKMCSEQPKSWDRYLPAVLFAYREAPQASLGFSPFELLYGRTVRGPLTILREVWDREEKEEVKTTYQYVLDLRNRLEETCKWAREQLGKSQVRYKHYYDSKARDRKFYVGDQVLLLLPTANNKLLLQWRGPYNVVEVKGDMDYCIDVQGVRKIFHANMLKLYHSRSGRSFSSQQTESTVAATDAGAVAVVEEEIDYEGGGESLVLPSIRPTETWKQVSINDNLTKSQQDEVKQLLLEYEKVWSDVPGRTTVIDHEINLVDEKIIRIKPYKIPFSLRSEVNEEIERMKEMDIIEPSNSPFSAPMVVVRKPDNSHRICLDFRRLNDVTVFDGEPMSDPEEIFTNVAGSKYFSKIDLTKGYWQIPLHENSKQYTAFQTDQGLFHFKVLPFGLVNAPATFNRLMRTIFHGMTGVRHFLDDILIHTRSWGEHIDACREVMERLSRAGMTARPSKCCLGMQSLQYLGHRLSKDGLSPVQSKVQQIVNAPYPTTKKELRSFLGLSGYYRRYIPHYSTIAAPLTDLVKKRQPNQLVWEDEHERAFKQLTRGLSTQPVLALPNIENEFILRTDASNKGLGAVLLQEQDGVKRPIAYASRKLLPREQRYSVIEKECLGLVWGIQKFSCYLYGKPFILETDHKPLAFLRSANSVNGRIMRWALVLQSYLMNIRVIKGSQNVGADYLSRL